jgi:hypothetical protein
MSKQQYCPCHKATGKPGGIFSAWPDRDLISKLSAHTSISAGITVLAVDRGMSSWSREQAYTDAGPHGETRDISVTRTPKSNAIQLSSILEYWSFVYFNSTSFWHLRDSSHSSIGQLGEDRLETLRHNGLHSQISIQEVYTVRGKINRT